MCDIFFKIVFAVMLAAVCGMFLSLSGDFFGIEYRAGGYASVLAALAFGLCAVGLLFV